MISRGPGPGAGSTGWHEGRPGQHGQDHGRHGSRDGRGPGPQAQGRIVGAPGDRHGRADRRDQDRGLRPSRAGRPGRQPEPVGRDRRGQGHARSTTWSRRAPSRRHRRPPHRRPTPTPTPTPDPARRRPRRRPARPDARRRRRPTPPPPAERGALLIASGAVGRAASTQVRRSPRAGRAGSRRPRSRAGRSSRTSGLRTRTPTSLDREVGQQLVADRLGERLEQPVRGRFDDLADGLVDLAVVDRLARGRRRRRRAGG